LIDALTTATLSTAAPTLSAPVTDTPTTTASTAVTPIAPGSTTATPTSNPLTSGMIMHLKVIFYSGLL